MQINESTVSRIHITHLIWHFGTGGLENGVVNLINHLPEASFKHSIVTLTGYDPDFAARIHTNNVSFFCLDKKSGQDWSLLGKLNRLLKKLQPDVLHSRNLATLELQIIGWWRRVPLRLHGEHGWDTNDVAGSNKKYQLLRRALKVFVHRFICLSAEAESYLQQQVHIAPVNIHRICNGVDTEKFAAATPAELASFGVKSTKPPLIIGTVGRLAKVKNQVLLLDAFAQLNQQQPELTQNCKLLLVGDGPCRDELERQVAAQQLQEQVIFTGNRTDIPQVMRCIDIFVLPSLAEGISNTMLEAMASGIPVIATKVGGNAELLPIALHSTNLVPSQDSSALAQAIQRYLKATDTRLADGKLLQQHCQQHFSISGMVSQYQQLYEKTRKHQ